MPLWKKIRNAIRLTGEIDVTLVGGETSSLYGEELYGSLLLGNGIEEEILDNDSEYEWRRAVHRLHIVNA